MNYQECKQVVQCDSCKKTFKALEVKLVEPSNNCQILTPIAMFKFVDKDGKIVGGSKQASKELGDKLMSCPYCDRIHLFGFDLSK